MRMSSRSWPFVTTIFFLAVVFVLVSAFCASREEAPAKPALQAEKTPSVQARERLREFSEAFEDAAAKVNPSVVPIFAEQVIQTMNPFGMPDDSFHDFFGDQYFRRFFGPMPRSGQKETVRSLGSGVIVTEDGYILTNNHVVQGADKLTVVLGDQKKYSAKVVGTDPQTDVALVRIEATGLPAATLGDSDKVKVGQWVIAVGNPFQLMHTVTAGIISAKGRSEVHLADYEDFIQTDASINPGNSGGALSNLDGEVIGINTAINTPSGGSVGIGFAIPINMARKVMDQLLKQGKVTRGYLALMPQDIDEGLAKAMGLKSTEGALVADVTPDGPADKAGIKQGDVILEFNGRKVKDSTDLRNRVAAAKPDASAAIKLLRDVKEMNVTVVLGERPKELKGTRTRPGEPEEKNSEKLGLSVQTLTPDLAEQLGYSKESGVVVTSVQAGSAADDAGLREGDLIKEVGRVPVRTAEEFQKAVSRFHSGETLSLLVRRGQGTFFVALQVP
jgi:serine protease Do